MTHEKGKEKDVTYFHGRKLKPQIDENRLGIRCMSGFQFKI